MDPIKVAIFDLYGDYAQFRKYFTNMSPLTFSIPPRTALSGILGAILGIDKLKNPETFLKKDCFLALRIINPIKKTKLAYNYVKSDSSMTQLYDYKNHKPTNVEFLRDVHYRVYFYHSNPQTFVEMVDMLQRHSSYYTVSLGIAGCLADYNFLGVFDVHKRQTQEVVSINSIIPYKSIEKIEFDSSISLQKTTVPMEMLNDREVISYEDVIYELSGASIPVVLSDCYYQIEGLPDIIHEY